MTKLGISDFYKDSFRSDIDMILSTMYNISYNFKDNKNI